MKREPAPTAAATTLWLTEAQTATRLNLSKTALQKWRLEGRHLRFARFGKAIRYAVSEVERFEADNMRYSTSDLYEHCTSDANGR